MDSEIKEVSAIQDEDVLRRMWQQTEDFGRKKEIRSHMYKLREARLKEFYTSGEVLKDVQRSNSSPGLREQQTEKNNQKWIEGGVTHADSLADHSFLSLKSKEIRDSESPTREVQFKNSKNRCDNDGTWTIASKTAKSDDGKTITNTQLATTQGSRPVDGGKMSYAAVNQQQASVYSDGDANNFTKAVGETSKTFAQQEVVTGDENTFKSSKTVSSSSSSKFVSHSSSSTIDDSSFGRQKQLQIEDGRSGGTTEVQQLGSIIEDTSRSTAKNIKKSTQECVKTQVQESTDIPDDLKKNILDGNTKVITETKTLPDGSTVTTTRYETKGSKKWSSTTGSTQVSSLKNRQVVEEKTSSTHHVDNKQVGNNQDKIVVTTATKVIENYPEKTESLTKHKENVQETKKSNTEQINKKIDVVITKEDVPQTPKAIKKEPTRPQDLELTKSCKPPTEPYKPSEATEGQYSTTYRSEFTPKRISVDISPTHDAFVRSLRAKSPENERPNSRGQSISSLRSSPEKSSTIPTRKSPERKPSYDRRSPDKYTNEQERRHTTSPSRPKEYSPDRTTTKVTTSLISSNTENITRKKSSSNITTRQSPERSPSPRKSSPSPVKTTKITRTSASPEKVSSTPIKTNGTTDTYNSDTITRKKKQPEDGNKISKPIDLTITTKTGTITKRKDKKTVTEKSQDASPTTSVSDFEFVVTNSNSHIVTDLDEPETNRPVKSNSSPVKEVPKRNDYKPSAPEHEPDEQPPTIFSVDDQIITSTITTTTTQVEPVCERPKSKQLKEKPPLKRTETYEERCRQILGLPEPETTIKKDEYEGQLPVEEPLFVKKHIDYGHPEDDIIRKTTDKIKARKAEKKDVDISEFITIERNIENDIVPQEEVNIPGYMRPIPKVSPEERDKMILESRQREISPEKEAKKSTTEGEYTTEYTDEFIDKKSRPSYQASPKQPKQKHPDDRNFNTEYTDEYDKNSTFKPTTEIITKQVTDDIKISKTYKQMETPVREKSPLTKQPEKKKPKTDKPQDSESTTSDDESVDIDEYYKTEIKTDIKSKDKKISRKSPSPVRRTSKQERESPSRGLPENQTVTQYINNYCKNDTTLDNKHLIDIEFNLEKENEQNSHIRTHRIDQTIITNGTSSPKRHPQKAVPSETIECSLKKIVIENGTPTKKKPQEQTKSPVKQPTTKKDINIKTSAVKTITKKASTTDVVDASPPSPVQKTVTKKVCETEQQQRKCSKKELFKEKQQTKPAHTSPERKSVKQPKPTQKHVVTKTISLTTTTRTDSKPQLPSPTKETAKQLPIKTTPKTITSVKTTKITQPATITVTKTIKQKPKLIENNITSDAELLDKKKVVTTTAKITMTNPKGKSLKPDVTMPSIKRSTSSREPSPDKICPVPVSSDDEYGYPRYPDQVSEPDDLPSRRKPQKIIDIPLTEEEDVTNFNRITELTTKDTTNKKTSKITDIDRVTETDESLLSVTEKVSKFITTAEKLTEDEVKTKKPAPKVARPELIVSEDLKEDECLLSVSDKVSKFITTAENVSTKRQERAQSPVQKTQSNFKVDEHDECLKSVNEKVSHFIHAAETSKQVKSNGSKDGPAPKVARPEFTDLDEVLQTDECLLSVSDKVSKFLTTAEKLTTETSKTKTEQFIKKEREQSPEMIVKREKSPEKKKPETPSLLHSPSRKSPERKSSERISPERTSPERKSPERTSPERKSPDRNSPERFSSHPKSEPVQPLKSSEAVKKAKAMFENISKTQDVPKQRDILSRPSIWEGKKKPTPKPAIIDDSEVKLTDIGVYKKSTEVKKQDLKDVTLKSTKLILNKFDRARSKSPEKEDLPGYMKPIHKVSPEERDQLIIESRLRESVTPEREEPYKTTIIEEQKTTEIFKTKQPVENGHLPGYMRPLQRCLSPERDHKKSVRDEEEIIIEVTSPKSPERHVPGYMKPLQRKASPDREKPEDVIIDDAPRAGKKFGVTLRRTDSGRVITTERRRSSTPGQPVIEEIQDLEILEKMMDKVVGYEQRRRIRAQIRVVKRLISENKINLPKRTTIKSTGKIQQLESKKFQSETQGKELKQTVTSRERSISPEMKRPSISSDKLIKQRSKSPEVKRTESSFKSSFTTTSRSDYKVERTSKERSLSPDVKKTSSTMNKHVKQPTSKLNKVEDDIGKPSWVTNRNLKKTTVTESVERRNVKQKETPKRSSSPQKDLKPTDCITSSYGIGPTDENGLPLFGIRALRKAATDKDEKVLVRGTVVTSQFYSENGEEPVGEVTVTKYSSDPKELQAYDSKTKGITSVTTTQKFGSRGTPTLKALTDKKKSITDKSEENEISKTTTSTKVTRRGSVKALSQKFIENAVEISNKEKQTSYPKAGLILRTSSFKDSTQSSTERTRLSKSSSRESSPGYQSRPTKISLESLTSDSRNFSSSTTSHSENTKTFLNSHTRVANAQDVITRMKNAEKEQCEGDSAEDREARMLLNKFLGAQVLMSAMEPLLGTGTSTQSAVSSSAQMVRKVSKTKSSTSTVKDSNKQVSIKQRFQCPITPEVLQDIWDEQTLRSLLEQCTDYEERRAIRARLRQVMAEQEAVANVISSAVTERDSSDNRHSVHERIETSKKTFTGGPITTTQEMSSRVINRQQVSKPMSPFAKFRQLDKQNSLNTPPSSPRTPTGSGAPLFKFTDPALSHSASTVKDRLLYWCQMKTKEYKNVKLENFSTSWADGLAFCALIHHFMPDAFDYHALTPQQRRHNFTLAFKVADEQAGIFPLLDVDDMVAMRRPDWKCVFTYVQAIYRRFKDDEI